MTTSPGQPSRPALRDRDHDQASQYLADVAARLTAGGTGCRLTRDGGVPTLTIEEPGGAPNPITVVIDPGNGPAPGSTAPASGHRSPAPPPKPPPTPSWPS